MGKGRKISGWFILAAVAIIGGVWYWWKHRDDEKDETAADDKKTDNGVTTVETPKTEKKSLYVPGAGQVMVDMLV